MHKYILLFIIVLFSIACGDKGPDSPSPENLVQQLADPATAAASQRALRDMGPSAVPALIKGLKNPDAKIRDESARTLAFIGPDAKDAVAALIESLDDVEPVVRADSAWALGEIGSAAYSAIPALIAALDDEEDTVRDSAVKALTDFGPAASDALPKLKDMAENDANTFIRESAKEAIHAIEAKISTDEEFKEGPQEPMD